jgi:hypothetical protein
VAGARGGSEGAPLQGTEGGQVTVVGLVAANCGYSRRNAVSLDRLRRDLRSQGVAVGVLGINARHRAAQLMASEFDRLVNFSVYQSTHREHHWSQLGGLKDDFFVYDRCGRLAYYVPFPHSFVPLRFAELAILSTHLESPCGPPPPLVDAASSAVLVGVRPMATQQSSPSPSRRPPTPGARSAPTAQARRCL